MVGLGGETSRSDWASTLHTVQHTAHSLAVEAPSSWRALMTSSVNGGMLLEATHLPLSQTVLRDEYCADTVLELN